MARATTKPDWQRAVIGLSGTTVAFLIIGLLFWARSIFIPIALAVFFTFVLAPVVMRLQRRGVGRLTAVILVVGASVVTFGVISWVVALQVSSLASTLPDKTSTIKEKVATAKSWIVGGENSRFAQMIDDIGEEIAPAKSGPKLAGEQPTVVVEAKDTSWTAQVQTYASPAIEFLGQSMFAFILIVFMLLKKEDLRNRILRLAAHGRMTTATKAVDDASRRVSSYLFTQLAINSGFGLLITIGLFAMGVKYALLWGLIATLMRYVPYIGTWVGLIPPTLFSVAVSDGWGQPAGVLALFLGLEAICNNVIEPWLYGVSLGVSQVAQLVAAAFWSFLWGPVGLILSGPMTTCLLVLGKYVPALKFLDVILGDEPPLDPHVMYFQRLAARDQDEAADVILTQLKTVDLAVVYDNVLVAALTMTKAAVADGDLDADDEKYVLAATRELVEETADEAARVVAHDKADEAAAEEKAHEAAEVPPAKVHAPADPVRVLACPARDLADQVSLDMLHRLLEPEKWEVRVTSVDTLTAELIDVVEEFKPAIVCIGSLPPGGLAHTRYLCKRLRKRFPNLQIVVGRWGQQEDVEAVRKEMADAGANRMLTTMVAAREDFRTWLPVLIAQATEGPPAAGPSPVRNGVARPHIGTPPAREVVTSRG